MSRQQLPWFRMYSEVRTDTKLRTLTWQQRVIWLYLLCYASEQPDRGTIAHGDMELTAIEVCDGDAEALAETLTRLTKLRIITVDSDRTIHFTNWDERQYDKTSDRPEEVAKRVAAHRERQRNADVTPSNALVTPSNADVTPSNADVTPKIREDKKREENTERRVAPMSQVSRTDVAPTSATANADGLYPWDEPTPLQPQVAPPQRTVAPVKPVTPTKPKATRAPDVIWDTVIDAFGMNPDKMTPTERGKTNRAVAELRLVNATPEGIRARVAEMRATWESHRITPNALAGNWTRLDPSNHKSTPTRQPTSLNQPKGAPMPNIIDKPPPYSHAEPRQIPDFVRQQIAARPERTQHNGNSTTTPHVAEA